MMVHEVMEETGISKKALLYYEEKGLIHVMKSDNGYRDYQPEALQRLWKIKVLRRLDFSISEISDMLEHPSTSLFQKHFNEIDKRIAIGETQKAYIQLLYEQEEQAVSTLKKIDQELEEQYQVQEAFQITIKHHKKVIPITGFISWTIIACCMIFCDYLYLNIIGGLLLCWIIVKAMMQDPNSLFDYTLLSILTHRKHNWLQKTKH